MQLAYWDIFKTMDDSTVRRLYNLSRLLAVLIVGFHLSLAVVKVLDMTTSDPKTLLFLKALLNTLVIESKPDKELPAIFSRCVAPIHPAMRLSFCHSIGVLMVASPILASDAACRALPLRCLLPLQAGVISRQDPVARRPAGFHAPIHHC